MPQVCTGGNKHVCADRNVFGTPKFIHNKESSHVHIQPYTSKNRNLVVLYVSASFEIVVRERRRVYVVIKSSRDCHMEINIINY